MHFQTLSSVTIIKKDIYLQMIKMKIYGKLGVSKEVLKEIEEIKKQNKGDIRVPDNALSHILCFRLS